jgi:hypothetical protein
MPVINNELDHFKNRLNCGAVFMSKSFYLVSDPIRYKKVTDTTESGTYFMP